MQQYMLKKENFNMDLVVFDKDDIHHINKVMRMKENDMVEVVNIDTKEKYLAKLNKDGESAIIQEKIEENSELPAPLILAYGLVKADKLEFVIQKATELGVTKFIPLIMDHSIVKYDDKKLDKKMIRWEKIIKEAAEQAHRNALMQITKPMTVKQLMEYNQDINLVAYEKANHQDKINPLIEKNKPVLLVIGPEGGISTDEIKLMNENKYHIVTLGKRILRTETAVISALSIITNTME